MYIQGFPLKPIFLTLLSVLFLHSCTYFVEEELYEQKKCERADLSYSEDVIPILTNRGCLACHGDLASLDLNGYDDLKVYIDNGAFLGSIRHEDGFQPMPQNSPKLSDCEINIIKAWIAQGALNN